MATLDCDVAVIGAGTAGISAERKARKCGARTLLIDPKFAGTTCATVGCMPSKLLIAAAEAAHAVRTAEDFGIDATARIDGAAVMERVRRMRDGFAQGVRDGLANLPEGITQKASARFTAPGELALSNGDTVRARAVVIATGSAPAVPEPFRALGDKVLTNNNVFELEDLPDSLGVIGAGPIGIELAQAFARLGVRVEVFDKGTSIGGLPDETSEYIHSVLEDEMPVHLGTEPQAELDGAGVRIRAAAHSAWFDRVLIGAGRPPQLDGLGLETTGLDLDDHGVPVFDPETLQCGDARIFIAGDANADRPLLHEASDEGAIAGYNAACCPDLERSARKLPLAVTFTRPVAAVVGEVPADDSALVTGRSDYADQGRARVENRPDGLLRLHAQKGTGRIVGADLALPDGEHIAHLLAWTISRGISVGEAMHLPLYHPTLEEGIKAALRDLCGKIDRAPAWDEDEGSPAGT